LLSNDHFPVDGALLRAWASHGSLQPVDGQHDAGQGLGKTDADAEQHGPIPLSSSTGVMC